MSLPTNWQTLRRRRQLRISRTGGRWSVEPIARSMVITGRRLVLIIHGYNNREEVAGKGYQDFYRELGELLPHYAFDHVWEVYWPGYW